MIHSFIGGTGGILLFAFLNNRIIVKNLMSADRSILLNVKRSQNVQCQASCQGGFTVGAAGFVYVGGWLYRDVLVYYIYPNEWKIPS